MYNLLENIEKSQQKKKRPRKEKEKFVESSSEELNKSESKNYFNNNPKSNKQIKPSKSVQVMYVLDQIIFLSPKWGVEIVAIEDLPATIQNIGLKISNTCSFDVTRDLVFNFTFSKNKMLLDKFYLNFSIG